MTISHNNNTRNASTSNSDVNDISNRLKYDKSELLISQSSQPIFDIAMKEAHQELSNEVMYRIDLFKKVKVFNHVDEEGMEILARSVEVVYYKTNDYLIKQGDIGDALYVLEVGQVAVTRTDPDENGVNISRNIAVLGPHRLFGEVSLMTDEPRNASIYVVSDTAKCLRLTREKFQEVIARKRLYLEKNRTVLSNNVIQTLPFLKTLPPTMKSELATQFTLVTIPSETYILREGTIGNNFYIIVVGTCLVTKNVNGTISNDDGASEEVELNMLSTGDFFGETALLDASSKRSANVKTVETCTCLRLTRQDFEKLLNTDENKKWFKDNTRRTSSENFNGSGDKSYAYYLSKFRRISSFDNYNRKCSTRIDNVFARVSKFMTESAFNSLYSRLYRRIVLNENKLYEYGSLVSHIYKTSDSRDEFIDTVRLELENVLKLDNNKRNYAECQMVHAIMSQRNNLRSHTCRNMPNYMYQDLSLKAELMKAKHLKYLVEGGSRGDATYLILRGCVRIFSVKLINISGKMIGIELEQDLQPGEIFGEETVKGVSTTYFSALAITDCEVLRFSSKALMEVQDTNISQSSNEQKTEFLRNVPTFRDWKLYNLFSVGKNLRLDMLEKGTQLLIKGLESKAFYFIISGNVNLVQKNAQTSKTLCCLQKYDYFGESSLINSELKKKQENKVTEQFSAICDTKCTLLVLEPEYYNLINIETVKVIHDIFMKKIEFRQEIYRQSHLSDRTMSRFAKKTFTGVEKVINKLIQTNESAARDDLSRNEHARQTQLPLILNNKVTERHDAKEWWDTDELIPGRSLEDYNMLFHNLNDPLMLTGTVKGSDRAKAKLLESIPTTIEDVTIRFKGKLASELQDDGYLSLSKKGTPISTARSDDDLSIIKTDRSYDNNKTRTPGRSNRSFITDAQNFLQNGLQGL